MSNPADFVTLDQATAAVSGSVPAAALATLPDAITRASRALQRYMQRDIVRSSYDEVHDGMGYGRLVLRQYPVLGPVTLRTGLTPVLTVRNTSPANQRATASLTTTGDTVTGLAVTGITLIRTASGVITPDTSTVFATYPTLQAAADHVNTLGNGWVATVTAGYGLWPAADLRAVQGNGNAANGSTASFMLHASDLSDFRVDERAGVVTLAPGYYDPAFAAQGTWGGVLTTGTQNVRALYTAGFDTVPEDLQMACILTVQAWATALATSQQFKSETAKSYSYTLPEKRYGLPQEAIDLVKSGGWRAYRRD